MQFLPSTKLLLGGSPEGAFCVFTNQWLGLILHLWHFSSFLLRPLWCHEPCPEGTRVTALCPLEPFEGQKHFIFCCTVRRRLLLHSQCFHRDFQIGLFVFH
jgi:hypothetical protein